MKISFLFPRWTEVFGTYSKLAKKTSGFPPLNMAILAAIAEKAGHEVQIIDGEIEDLTNQDIIDRLIDQNDKLRGQFSTQTYAEKCAVIYKYKNDGQTNLQMIENQLSDKTKTVDDYNMMIRLAEDILRLFIELQKDTNEKERNLQSNKSLESAIAKTGKEVEHSAKEIEIKEFITYEMRQVKDFFTMEKVFPVEEP